MPIRTKRMQRMQRKPGAAPPDFSSSRQQRGGAATWVDRQHHTHVSGEFKIRKRGQRNMEGHACLTKGRRAQGRPLSLTKPPKIGRLGGGGSWVTPLVTDGWQLNQHVVPQACPGIFWASRSGLTNAPGQSRDVD